MSFHNRLKEARITSGMTQEELAIKIGVTKGAIANYENNVSHPKEEILYRLFDVLKVEPNFLFQDEVPCGTIKVTTSEMEILKKYRRLDASGRDMVDTVLDKEVERLEARENQKGGEEYITLPIAARGPLSDDAVLTAEEKVAADAKHPELAPKKRNDY